MNETALRLANARIVLISSEAIDTEELCVPQEWIEIPGWIADYYFVVQVNPDDACVTPVRLHDASAASARRI